MSDTIPTRPHRRRSWAEPFKIKVVEPIKMTTRAVENAYFIQQGEEGYRDKLVAGILREMCSYTDDGWGFAGDCGLLVQRLTPPPTPSPLAGRGLRDLVWG